MGYSKELPPVDGALEHPQQMCKPIDNKTFQKFCEFHE